MPLRRLKNPSKARTDKFISAVTAYHNGLLSMTATNKITTGLNKSARPRKGGVEWLEAPEAPKLPKEQKVNVVYNSGIITINQIAEQPPWWYAYRAMKQSGLVAFRMIITRHGRIDPNTNEPLPDIDKSVFVTRNPRQQFMVEGESDTYLYGVGDRLVILKPNDVQAERLFQKFADGISHCVFTPIYNKYQQLIDNSKSAERTGRLKGWLKQLKVLEEKYKTGVPENCMEEVAKTAHIKMPFVDIFQRNEVIYNENGKAATVSLQNTRFNHVEVGNLVLNAEPVVVTQEEINKIWNECHRKNEFYDVMGSIKDNNINMIKTLTKIYKVENPINDLLQKFNESIGLHNYKFNCTKYPEVYKFISAGCIIHSEPVQLNEGDAEGHIDMPKAYTQFKKCHMYNGFLGVIHQWGESNFSIDFLNSHIGIYKIKVTNCVEPLLISLGITDDSEHILPSVEILYFISLGLECSIVAGVWGSIMEFEFPDYMMIKDNGLSRYAKWSGKLKTEYTETKHTVKASEDYAKRLKYDYPNLEYWADRGTATVGLPNKGFSNAAHILAFITSYVRIQMIEEMRKFEPENILKVVLDGIYFKGPKPDTWLIEKPFTEHKYCETKWYKGSVYSVEGSMIFDINTLLTGQGGCGKTYGVMNAGNFNSPLYVVPCHLLGQDGNEKYDCRYATIHRLLGKDCTAYKADHAVPGVIFIDEITQYPADWVEQIFEMYNDSLIILAGDISASGQWFQCRMGTPGMFAEIWKPTCDVEIKHIEGDRRSRDPLLKELKLKIREKMVEIFIDGDSCESEMMKEYAKTLNTISYGEAITKFVPGDTWLASTHRVNNLLIDAGICSGYIKPGGKISPVELPGYKKRGSYTIHSIQGKTIETGKIYISVDDLFEYAMLYTAVSRAVNYEQIVLVY